MRDPGPYQLEIPYIIQGFTHYFHVNCDVIGSPVVGSAPADVDMRTKGSGPTPLSTSANLLWATIRPLLSTTTLASTYVLWKFQTTNQDRIFISGGDLTAPNGSNVATPTLAWQGVMSFRSGGGNIGKLQVMEPVIALNGRYPLGGGAIGETVAVKNYLMGSTCIVMARDRSFPVAPLNESFGQNDTLRDKRFRS